MQVGTIRMPYVLMNGSASDSRQTQSSSSLSALTNTAVQTRASAGCGNPDRRAEDCSAARRWNLWEASRYIQVSLLIHLVDPYSNFLEPTVGLRV